MMQSTGFGETCGTAFVPWKLLSFQCFDHRLAAVLHLNKEAYLEWVIELTHAQVLGAVQHDGAPIVHVSTATLTQTGHLNSARSIAVHLNKEAFFERIIEAQPAVTMHMRFGNLKNASPNKASRVGTSGPHASARFSVAELPLCFHPNFDTDRYAVVSCL